MPELPRLRLSSLDPAAIDDDLWRLIAEEPRLMPHLHLSLQAGDDLILKRMKRRHLRADAIAFCRRARATCGPDIVFGADLIAGFPTETEAMFEDTLDLVDECGLTFLHVFPYSARPGTPAARMPQVRSRCAGNAAARLREAGGQAAAVSCADVIGHRPPCWPKRKPLGHTEHFAAVRLARPSNRVRSCGLKSSASMRNT